MGTAHWALLVAVLAVGGCSRDAGRAEQAPDSAGMMDHMDSGGMDMGGMRMQGMQMMPQMRAHMDSMKQMSPQQMRAMMAMHQSMMSQMMDGMGSDMRGMTMTATPEWGALIDSVKQDLAELPNVKGQALSARMQAHADRVSRLIAMHEQMMGK